MRVLEIREFWDGNDNNLVFNEWILYISASTSDSAGKHCLHLNWQFFGKIKTITLGWVASQNTACM